MVWPVVISSGTIRSGSTWSFNVCRLLGQLLADRRGESLTSAYLEGQKLDHFLQAEAFLGQGPAVFKAHFIAPMALEWIRTGRAKAVCTIRDPRDCVASDLGFTGQGFDKSVTRVVKCLGYLKSYLDFGRTLFIRYEEMMNDRLAQIRLIAAHLQIRIDQKEAESIDHQTNLVAARKHCQELGKLGDDRTHMVVGTHRRHHVTLLHDNHVDTGKVDRWKEDLTAEQGRHLTQLFREILLVQGYGTQASIRPYLTNRHAAR